MPEEQAGDPVTAALRAAAVGYCRAGWPVVPTHPESGRLVSMMTPECPDMARQWWDRPYGIGCMAGVLFDVLELPSWLGERVLSTIDHVAMAWELRRPFERTWWFPVTPGSSVVMELGHVAPRVRLHGVGAVVTLPPTPVLGGTSRWVARQPGPLRLPHSLTVQWAIIKAATAARGAAHREAQVTGR